MSELRELAASDGGQFRGVPEVRTREQLFRFVTMLLFHITVTHRMFATAGPDYYAYAPVVPTYLRLPLPRSSAQSLDAETLAAALPTLEESALQASYVVCLDTPPTAHSLLAAYDPERFFPDDPTVWRHVARFRRDLAEAERVIEEREERARAITGPLRLPGFRYLRPSNLLQSPWQ